MVAFLIDSMGYLATSGLLDGFFSFSAICIVVMVVRQLFERGV